MGTDNEWMGGWTFTSVLKIFRTVNYEKKLTKVSSNTQLLAHFFLAFIKSAMFVFPDVCR